MVEYNHNVVSFNADTVVKAAHGVIVNVYVSKTGSSGSKCIFKNGTSGSGTTEFTIFSEILLEKGLTFLYNSGSNPAIMNLNFNSFGKNL